MLGRQDASTEDYHDFMDALVMLIATGSGIKSTVKSSAHDVKARIDDKVREQFKVRTGKALPGGQFAKLSKKDQKKEDEVIKNFEGELLKILAHEDFSGLEAAIERHLIGQRSQTIYKCLLYGEFKLPNEVTVLHDHDHDYAAKLKDRFKVKMDDYLPEYRQILLVLHRTHAGGRRLEKVYFEGNGSDSLLSDSALILYSGERTATAHKAAEVLNLIGEARNLKHQGDQQEYVDALRQILESSLEDRRAEHFKNLEEERLASRIQAMSVEDTSASNESKPL